MEVLALILAHPGDPNAQEAQEEDEGEESDEEKKEKAVKKGKKAAPKKTQAKGMKQGENKDDMMQTNATLVLCPPHLTKQWHEEIEKYTKPKMSVVSLANVNDVRAHTCLDIINADVVIVPFTLLENDNYQKLHEGKFSALPPSKKGDKDRFDFPLNGIWKSGRIQVTKGKYKTALNYFSWRRLVVDEGHLFYHDAHWNKRQIRESFVKCMAVKYIWFVSGTPFAHGIDAAMSILRFPPDLREEKANELIPKYLLWRNTKESEKEHKVPPQKDEVHLLDFTPLERASYQFQVIFNGNYEAGLANRCNERPADKERTISLFESAIARTEIELKKDEEKLKACGDSDFKKAAELLKFLEKAKSQLAEANEWVEKLKKMGPYYSGKSMEKLSVFPDSNEEEKPTAKAGAKKGKKEAENTTGLLESEIVDMTVPQLKQELEKRGVKVPSKAKKTDLQNLLKEATERDADTNEKEEEPKGGKRKRKDSKNSADSEQPTAKKLNKDLSKEEQENLLNWLVETEGTKYGNFIFYLIRLWTKEPEAKVIIFSQNDAVLYFISEMFVDKGVEHGRLEKNVVKRVKVIKKFKSKDSPMRALLLPIRNNATGTNIIEATHVILFDLVMHDRWAESNDLKALEAQAIGRAVRQGQTREVKIVRFIIKDTIEHKQYLELYGDSALPKVR
eukprot:Phypoly_transcript_03989.p1 GENE.Phypoly_transcript_03989~~Phypoly_transcript_03989.p1  ORF type:complete len:728 (+),score=155.12 Phypoly_transcript_03989:158-2185(+)